ncbi:MAG: YlxM family DNA-binding protein [Lachnospiraceae bacterium]|nr:YlxM family DNA-binding protein [Lachnospiraceae bacterium]
MESFVEKSYLYDFYGELLTEHQRQVYEQIMFEDLSASEVAREAGISRQGVHDMIRRCERILEDYESKLHLVEKFLHIRDNVQKIQGYADTILKEHPLEEVEQIKSIASDILEEL